MKFVPSIDSSNIILLTLLIKLGLMKNLLKALDKEGLQSFERKVSRTE